MKIKHKKIAYKVLNVCVTFLFIFQSIYPFFYNPRVYAQTKDTIIGLEEVRESSPSQAVDDGEDPIPETTSDEYPTQDQTSDDTHTVDGTDGPILVEITEDISIEEEQPEEVIDNSTTTDTEPDTELIIESIESVNLENTSPATDVVVSDEKDITENSISEKEAVDSEEEPASIEEQKEKTISDNDPRIEQRSNDKKDKREKEEFSRDPFSEIDYKPGEVLVKYKSSEINLDKTLGRAEAGIFEYTKKLKKVKESRRGNIALLKIKDNKSVKDKIEELEKDKRVEYAEPNYKRYPQAISTNDTYKGNLWGLDNTGQNVNGYTGTSDADIDAPEAWNIDSGSSDIIVAVIDDGVAYNHPDLANNMWDGSSCLDSSGSSLGGCVHGYDFEDSDKDPYPTDGSHGTYAAGVIAATRNNNQGILGVAPKAKIMALKHDFYVASEVMAIDFAIQNGAKVINASFTATSYSQAEYDAINRFKNSGGVFIAAAGNQASNNESTHRYPSDLSLDNIISVTATNQDDNLSDFSNYGSTSVDVGAPGENIYTTSLTYSDTTIIDEDFESVTPPAVPSGWSENGTFATIDYSDIFGPGWKVIYGDLAYPYSTNNDSTFTSQAYNVSDANDLALGFYTECDTEYPLDGWHDYMAVEASSDGSSFNELDLGWGEGKYDEPMLDIINGEDPLDDSGYANSYLTVSIPSEYYTNNFKLRFRWVTDSDSDTGTYGDGCLIDDIVLIKRTTSSYDYEYVDGTSFAAPHTAGLAALLFSIDNSLTYTQVRNAILNTGDTLSDLVGKTTTGKRINAYNAIQSFNGSKAITSFDFDSLSVAGVINESAHTVSLTVPYGTDVTNLTPTIVHTGDSISPASGVPQNFTSPVIYTVTAVNSTTQDYTVAVTVEAPSTVTTVSSSTYTVTTDTISDVPYGTSKATFLSNLTKDDPNQTWDDSAINDSVLTGDKLVVTAEDGTTTRTYTVSVDEVAPILDPIGNKIVDELSLLSFTATSTDPDGSSTSYYLTDEPTGASINGSSGEFTFTPTETQGPGVYNLTVWVTDGSNTDFEDISITVNEVNSPPFSAAVSDSLDEDTNKLITLNATDSDIPSNTLTYSIVSNPTDGTLGTISGNEIRYTPDADYNGGDSFTYKANDGQEDSNTATVNITVNPINDAPTANDDSYNTQEDTPVLITLTGNDIDGDSLSFNLLSTPSHGSLEILSGEQMNYIPDENYAGSDSLTFKANDGQEDSNTAIISITINGVNDTPVLDPIGDKSVDELDTLNFTATATDPDSALTYSLINAPGGASIGPSSGVFSFTPDETQGPYVYTLTVSVTDGNTSDEEEIDITVNEVNVAPVVSNLSVSTDEDTEKVISLDYTDPDLPENSITHIIGDFPTNGSLSAIVNGEVTYTPNAHFNGSDSFTYKVNDGSVDSDIAEVTVNVISINDAPSIITSAPISATEDILYTYDADSSDADGPSAVWSINTSSDSCGGTIDPNTGIYSFTPAGPVPVSSCDLSITISDYGSPNLSDTETATITVTAVNDLPASTEDSYSTDEDNTLTISAPGVLENDTDPEGSPITAILVSDVSNGSLTLNPNGSFEYIPNLNYYGSDTFVYKANDGTDYGSNTDVTITVNSVNDAPVANSDSASIDEDSPLVVSKTELLSNDTDVDNDHSALDIVSVQNPVNGTVYIDGDNVVFTPAQDYYGSAGFEYTVSDGYLSDNATVGITVNAVNDAPIIDSSAPTTATEDIEYSYDAEVTDPDGPSAIWSKTEQDTCGGSLDANSGMYTFTPVGPVPAADCTLSIKVSDGGDPLQEDTETVVVSITAVNDAPIAYATSGSTDEDNYVDITLSGDDPENDSLIYIVDTYPSHGDVTIVGNVATYTPDPGYNGSDSFYFIVNDGYLDSNTAEVSLTITGINDAPVIDPIDNQTIDEYYYLEIQPAVSDVDGGTPTFSLTNTFIPNSSINTETGLFSFTPDETQGGNVFDFTIQVDDGNDVNNTASESFSVTVQEVNNAPIANDDTSNVNEDETLTINHSYLLSNDTDPDNAVEDFEILSVSNADPVGSTLVLNASNIEFTPPENYFGQASFEYVMTDGESTDTGLVTITVDPVNDAPDASDDQGSTDEDNPYYVLKNTLLSNDSDIDGDSMNVSGVGNPVNGSVVIDGNNVVFTPDANYFGPASFDYTITDGLLDDTATVSITVNSVNDVPSLDYIGSKTIDELNELSFTATATDNDDEDTLSFSLANEPTGATINPSSGLFSFTPSEAQGPNVYDVEIIVSDGTATDSEIISVTVNEVNTAPTATELWESTNEDTELVITLEGNDVDVPTQSVSFATTDPSHGTVSLIGDQVTYNPNENFYGEDSFTYKANDGVIDSNIATVHITVNPINDGPVASPDSTSGNEDEDTVVSKDSLLSNDTDVDDTELTLSSVQNPVNGSISIDGENVVFTPDSNFNGTAYFDYTMTDGEFSDSTTVTVTVNPVNDAPTANSDNVSVDEDTSKTITLTGNDVDGDSLTFAVVDNPSNGYLGSVIGNEVEYTPNENYEGSDSFTFKTNDGLLDSNTATISITINEYNDPPVLDSIGNKSTDELTELTFTVNATDPDSVVTYYLSGEPAGAVIDSNSGLFSFTPAESQGPQVFTFDVNVTDGNSTDSETINVTVNEVNVSPAANDKDAFVDEDQSVEVTLEGNDVDIPAQSLSYIKVTDPSNGVVTFNSNIATYSPNGDFFGSDSFTYKVNDGVSDSNVATVNVTVSAVNDAPVANPDTASVDEDDTLTVLKSTLISNDTDVDDTSLTLISVANPSNGTVFIDGDNVIFNPYENYNGQASFDYSVSDGSLDDTTSVTVTVNPINDAPTVDDDTALTDEDNTVAIYLIGNDIDGDSLSYYIVDSTANGTLGGPYGNQVLYTPNENFNGSDAFTFKANDGSEDSNIGTINITINPINDSPELDSIGNKSTDELTNLNFTVTASDDDAGDTLLFSTTNAPTGATIDPDTGEFNFLPTENQGPNTYFVTISVSDGEDIDSEEIEITVNEVNVAPISYDVAASTNEDTPKTIVLNSYDEDIPENSLTYIVESGVSHGVLGTIAGDEVVYTPSENFNGEDSFTYKVNDGTTDSNISTVTITVLPINDAPVAISDSGSTDEDNDFTVLKVDLLANDTDVDFDPLSVISVSNANNGVAYIDGANVVFSPTDNFNGSASFDYTVSDGALTDVATVSITVNAVNDAPTTNDDSYTTTQEAPIDITLLGDDIENDSLTYSIVSVPLNGTLSVISGNQVAYTPDVDYVGDDSFTYLANDSEYDSNISTIEITVYPPPVISGESSSEVESTSITIEWVTDHPSTSRVIYDTVSHPTLGTAPNYGYAYSTVEIDNSPMVTSHSVTVSPLDPETTYYFRAVSHGSPEVVGDEISFTTKSAVEEDTEAPDRPENVELTYNSDENTIKVTWENNDEDIDDVSVYMGDNEDFDEDSDSRVTKNDYDDEDVTVDNIKPGKTYYFKLVAEDKAGNKSKTRTVSIEIPEEPEEEVVVTDISESTLGAGDEESSSEDISTVESEDESVLGTETSQDEDTEKTIDMEKETETSDSNTGFKYVLIIGFILTAAIAIFLKKRK